MRKLLNNVIESAIREGADISWAPHYSEPGYSDSDDGVYFANWNPTSFTPRVDNVVSRIGALLAREGATLEWSDEWTTCNDCGGAVRTSADCYSWTPNFVVIDECEIVCHDCLDIDTQESRLINNPDHADTLFFDWESRGWRRAEEHATGWHPGQTDDPHEVFARLSPEYDVLFTIDAVGQFDAHWSAWIR
jgi:hypothetical protein